MNITFSNCSFGSSVENLRKPVKVENAALLKELAEDIVRMANCDHPMLVDTYERFVEEGIKYPSFAQMTLKHAEYDSYYKSAVDFQSGLVTQQEHLQRFKNTRGALSMLDKSFLGMRLYSAWADQSIESVTVDPTDTKAYKKALKNAKKYMQKKISVLAGLAETSTQLTPCSVNKSVKKFTYRFLRLINR